MSSLGQAAGGIGGAVIGFFASGGNPMGALYGAQIGMGVGGLLDPPKGPNITGPRLSDLSVQTSTYGANIPRTYGTIATMGNIFWLEGDKIREVEVKSQQGGKGGPTSNVTSFSYFATFALGLGKGPKEGVRRVWLGPKLIYDAGGGDVETIMASNQSGGVGGLLAGAVGQVLGRQWFKFYNGAEDQEPDPRMQADKGVANTPAYRGRAYMVFYDLPLEEFGNSLLGVQVKVELSDNMTSGFTTASVTMPTPTQRFVMYGSEEFIQFRTSEAVIDFSADGATWFQRSIPVSTTWKCGAYGAACGFVVIAQSGTYLRAINGRAWSSGDIGIAGIVWSDMVYGNDTYVAIQNGGTNSIVYDGTSWVLGTLPASRAWVGIDWNGSKFVAVASASRYGAISDDGLAWTEVDLLTSRAWSDVQWTGERWVACAKLTPSFAVSDDGVTWSAITVPAGAAPHAGTSVNWNRLGCDGGALFCVSESDTSTAHLAVSFDHGATWSAALMQDENWRSIAVTGDAFVAACPGAFTQYGYANSTFGGVLLSEIVAAECDLSESLQPSDYDVTALTSVVKGYRVASTGSIRSALEPLQAAWPFDVVQAGYKLKFIPRGNASVATIPASLLDARSGGDTPGVELSVAREMDSQLPKRVSVKHLDFEREYDQGEQSASRINTDAVNIREVDLPIVMSATEAAQKAEVLLYLYWMERSDVAFRLPPEYINLEPADVITVEATNATYQLRLTEISYLPDGRLECRAKFNNSAVYVPTAVGESGLVTGQTVKLAGATLYQLLDVPALKATMNEPAILAAMTGYTDGWPGGILFRSNDGGQVWSAVQAWSQKCTIGIARGTMASRPPDVIDTSLTLQADMIAGSLESVSLTAVLNGANHFAYGQHGRWEIIAALNCTLQGDGSYILSDFLRGRFGTSQHSGVHAAGDYLIHLNDPDVAFIGMEASVIGSAREYRGVTAGKSIDSDADLSFTYSANNLKPLAPVHFTGYRNAVTNDWHLSWTRRTRVDGEWRDLVDAALSEASEAYEIDVFSSAAYTTLKRTLTATSQSVIYTTGNQVTDFGANQATLYVKIYQMSATVGRGFPLTISITRT